METVLHHAGRRDLTEDADELLRASMAHDFSQLMRFLVETANQIFPRMRVFNCTYTVAESIITGVAHGVV